jgi:hypothetical protein
MFTNACDARYFAGKGDGNGAAHNNTAADNTICNAGPAPPPRDPWDEVDGKNVTGNCVCCALHWCVCVCVCDCARAYVCVCVCVCVRVRFAVAVAPYAPN